MKLLYVYFFSLCGIILTSDAFSQSKTNDNLRVFLDCQSYCDKDYIKREITFIDYVNDRFQSNIYIN